MKSLVIKGDYWRVLQKIPDGTLDLILLDPDFRLWEQLDKSFYHTIWNKCKPDAFVLTYACRRHNDTIKKVLFDTFFQRFDEHVWTFTRPAAHPGIRQPLDLHRYITIWRKGTKQRKVKNVGAYRWLPSWFFEKMAAPGCKGWKRGSLKGWVKPFKMQQALVEAYSKKGENVLDLFAGSGNSYRDDRHWIGVDQHETHSAKMALKFDIKRLGTHSPVLLSNIKKTLKNLDGIRQGR